MNVKKEASSYEGVIISTGLCFLFPSVSTHFHSLSSSSSTPSVPGTPWPLLSLGSVCLHRECEKSRRRRIINSETTLALFFASYPSSASVKATLLFLLLPQPTGGQRERDRDRADHMVTNLLHLPQNDTLISVSPLVIPTTSDTRARRYEEIWESKWQNDGSFHSRLL